MNQPIARMFSAMIAGLVLLGVSSYLRADDTAAKDWTQSLAPGNSFQTWILYKDRALMSISVGGWGPNWGWAPGPQSTARGAEGEFKTSAPFVLNAAEKTQIGIDYTTKKVGDKAVSLKYDLSADKDVPLTMLMASFSFTDNFNKGQVVLTGDTGDTTLALPLHLQANVDNVKKIVFECEGAEKFEATIDPPCRIQPENNALRVMLAHEVYKKGQTSETITLNYPTPAEFLVTAEEGAHFNKSPVTSEWFAFNPTADMAKGEIGMQDWLEAPAGKHGGVRMVGDHFEFEDHTRVKFWGSNLAYAGNCAPEKANADATAAKFAKYGVNGVRLHKFLGPLGEGINDTNDCTKFDAPSLDKLDYFTSDLTKAGVYYGFSHTYGLRVGPDNKPKLLAYDEIARNGNNTYALINFAEDVQDLLIQRLVTLLQHKNAYTGKTYAEDPALSYIECHNEDDIFFFTTPDAFNKYPTYAKHFTEQWCDWLKAKYGTLDDLKKAWPNALQANETFDAKNIALQPNPWNMGTGGLKQQDNNPGMRQRLLDNAQFFYETQLKFYKKFEKAVRDAGYKGPLVGSPWQAPAMLPHYYNLKADYEIGYIDRHNYFGEKVEDTMLGAPGSGYFGSGLQQVIDRPFGISEWVTVYPDLYSAEGPAIMAVYGMGLNDWDASYEFQSASGRPFNAIAGQPPYGVWEADVPTQLGQYPLLGRMVTRGDVKASDIISIRKVSNENLLTGKFDFNDEVTQSGDVKSFNGTVPAMALAAGRCVVQFTDKTEASTFPDMTKYLKDKVITSSTGQLIWNFADKGFFTINTDGTKGVVGFADGKPQTLGDVAITSKTPYASILITASAKDENLSNCKTALVSAVARNANTGFQYFSIDYSIINNGQAPIMLEPVKADVTFAKRKIKAIHVLDQDGKMTDAQVDLNGQGFSIDTGKTKSIYLQIEFAE